MIQFYKTHQRIINPLVFLIIMSLTIHTILKGTDLGTLITGIASMKYRYLFICVVLSMIFVIAEGSIFHILLNSQDHSGSLLQGIRYSLLGYFYSGITPSATGGQPVQLYYMTKDGHKVSDSSVSLITMAFLYKVVMVILGGGLLLLWRKNLDLYFGNYLWVFHVGLLLNTIALFILLGLMIFPDRLKILCGSKIKNAKARVFVEQYSTAVEYLLQNYRNLGILFILTFIQRGALILMPAVIYMGLGLDTTSILTIILIQSAIYVSVDMLPVPGAQGITELIYLTAYSTVFSSDALSVSLVITRGLSFYLIFLVSMFVVIWSHYSSRLLT